MNNAYQSEALRTAEICASNWNRDPASPSFGCFDRPYWGWKKKDIADAALQAAVTLCIRLAEHRGSTRSLVPLLDGYVGFLERVQHRDGSFDQFYPHEKAPGVFHDLLSALIWLLRSPYPNDATKRRLESIIRRGVAYALAADEHHGSIANHFIQFAWEFLNYAREFADPKAEARGREYLERALRLFNAQEGWFREYDGPDAGYQTRLLSYLTRIADLIAEDELWGVAEKAARFVEAMLMPDDALHPMLGVRSTALVYPSGFERLAVRSPVFAALAERIHRSWAAGTVPLPSLIDFENGIRLAEDAFEAAQLRSNRLADAAPDSAGAEFVASDFDMPQAGLHRRILVAQAKPMRTLHVASKLGAVVVVHGRDGDGTWRLLYEDAGYLLHLATEDSRWVLRRAGAGRIVEQSANRLRIEAHFERSLHEELTPLRLIALRILNLTVLRSQWIGDLFRKLVVRRLIAGSQRLPLRLNRSIEILDGRIAISDRLEAAPDLARRIGGARLFRCRRTIGNHMASSRYFQPHELSLDQPWLEEVPIEVLDGRLITRTID